MAPPYQTACRTQASVAIVAFAGLVAMAAAHPHAPVFAVVGGSVAAVIALSLALLPLTLEAASRRCPMTAMRFTLSAGALCLVAAMAGLLLLAGHIS